MTEGEMEVNGKNTEDGKMFGWVGVPEERGPFAWPLAG